MASSIKNEHPLFLLIISFIVTFLIFIFYRLAMFDKGFDLGVDVYYHIKVADMFPFISTTKHFPWTEMSIWKTNFYDKELGFHAILYVLRNISNYLGFSSGAPFNFIDFSLVFIVLLSTSIGGYIYNKSTSLMIPPLLVFASPLFLQKLFMIVVFILLWKTQLLYKCIIIFFFGWIYSLCYSVPHIIIIPVVCYIFAEILMLKNRRACYSFFLLLSAILGLCIGLVIHPQFPNTFIGWYVQGVIVIKQMFGLSVNKVVLGTGVHAPDLITIVRNFLPLFFFVLYAVYFYLNKKKSIRDYFLFILLFVLTLGFFYTKRFNEYSVPLSVFCLAYAVRNYKYVMPGSKIFSFIDRKKITLILVFLFISIPYYKNFSLPTLYRVSPPYEYAKWASKNLKPGTYVGLLYWYDFPLLFYAADQFTYPVALDPMYGYYVYPQRMNVIDKFRLGEELISPKKLADAFGTNLLFVSYYNPGTIKYLLNKGAKVLYDDSQGALLNLVPNTLK